MLFPAAGLILRPAAFVYMSSKIPLARASSAARVFIYPARMQAKAALALYAPAHMPIVQRMFLRLSIGAAVAFLPSQSTIFPSEPMA